MRVSPNLLDDLVKDNKQDNRELEVESQETHMLNTMSPMKDKTTGIEEVAMETEEKVTHNKAT